MILIVDGNGNAIPAASLRVAGRVLPVGDNAWQVSQGGVAIHDREVTRETTLSKSRSVTQEAATRMYSATRERGLTEWQGTREVTHLLSGVGTVSTGLSELTVTRPRSATRMVTDYLTRERTVTREVSAMLSKPGATVTNMVTRERTVTAWANLSWSISYYPWWTRGTDYDLNIQYYKVTGEDFDDWEPLDHVPGQPLSLSLVTNPTGDGITPTSVDTTGWVNGFKEVTGVHLYGGTGSGVVTIRVSDPELNLSLDLDINLNAAQTTKSPSECHRFYGVDTAYATYTGEYDGYNYYEPDDWEATSGSMFDSMQVDAKNNFLADAAADSVTASGTVAQHYVEDLYNYIYARCYLYGGWVRIYISETDKENLIATHLRITPQCYNSYGNFYPWGTYVWSPYLSRFVLRVKFAESPAAFTSGAAMAGMSPDLSLSFSQIKDMLVARGATPTSSTDIYIPFSKSVIENMTGNDLYVGVYIDQTIRTPYTYPYFKATLSDTSQSGRQYFTVNNVRVELTK